MNEYIQLAIKESKKSLKTNDVPIGCVIVKNNKIIAKAHNKREKNKNITHHAEILALIKANKKLKTWHLDGCIMYVTLEPCMMCTGAILQSHIKKIIYCAENEKTGYAKNCKNLETILEESIEYQNLLKNFFKNLRMK